MMIPLRIATRRLLRSPGLTAAAVATLALGVAANATIFAVVEATLVRPLPYPDAERLVAIDVELRRESGAMRIGWSWSRFEEFAKAAPLEDAAVYADTTLTLSGSGGAERVPIEVVSAPYFKLLGVRPALGTVFAAGAEPLAVISHVLWVRRFGADPGVVGRAIIVNGKHALVVAGVAPAGFQGLTGNAELWIPVQLSARLLWPGALNPRNSWLPAIARLPRGQSIDAARAAASRIFDAIDLERPGGDKASVALTPLHEARTDPMLRRAAMVLLGAVAFLLLIAAANLSNLLLARAAARQRDVAILSALGASRARVIADFLAEAVILAGAGGVLGILLSAWGLDALLALRPTFAGDAQFWRDLTPSAIRLGVKALLMATAVAVASGLASALPAALLSSRRNIAEALHEGGPGSSRGAGVRALSGRGALVVVQLAVSLVLVLGAGLLLRSLLRLRAVDPGFEPAGMVVLRLHQSAAQNAPARTEFIEQALARARAIPGLQAASVDRCLPLTGSCDTTQVAQIEGQSRFEEGRGPEVGLHFVGSDHIAALRARLVDGRFFTATDRAGAPSVVVLNEIAARRLFPEGRAVGRRIDVQGTPAKPEFVDVVGVISDVRYGLPHEPVQPALFFPALQEGIPGTWLLLRARPGIQPGAIAASAHKMIADLDPELAVSAPRLLDAVAADATAPQRFAAVLLAVFAGIALLLSGAGVYGVLSVSVEQRQREIGIRLALGARRVDVLRLVTSDALRLTVAGLAVGGAIAAAALRLVSSLLYGVSTADPLIAAASVGVLLAFAATATLLPAWRGVCVDPALAMRAE